MKSVTDEEWRARGGGRRGRDDIARRRSHLTLEMSSAGAKNTCSLEPQMEDHKHMWAECGVSLADPLCGDGGSGAHAVCLT